MSPQRVSSGVRKEVLSNFVAEKNPKTPFLLLDIDIVRQNYKRLQNLLPYAMTYYAVKASPNNEILAMLNELGSSFDIASRYELDQCLAVGISAEKMSYGNTIKKEEDIAYAYEKGVRLFAFDSEQELKKIAQHAPESKVFCRILTSGEGADWPLSIKFGCTSEMAENLLVDAKKKYKLDAYGISFHVGSQQHEIGQWGEAITKVGTLFSSVAEKGVKLRMVNIGGGFPAQYVHKPQQLSTYTKAITHSLKWWFGKDFPEIIIEPGRSLVGDCGILVSEVVLVSKKTYYDEKRWVYLDVGKFSGLIETLNESIKYRITSDKKGAKGPVILAGPTCDSMDILYQNTYYELPLSLKPKDRVYFHSTGAYTTSYSSICFNGFPPLTTHVVDSGGK